MNDIALKRLYECLDYAKKIAEKACLADCDMCGLCKVFHSKDPENAYDDYIKGTRSFADVSDEYKR